MLKENNLANLSPFMIAFVVTDAYSLATDFDIFLCCLKIWDHVRCGGSRLQSQ